MTDWTDFAILAKRDPAALARLADAQREEIRQLRAAEFGTQRLVLHLAWRWRLSAQQARVLAAILTLRRASYQAIALCLCGGQSVDHIKVVMSQMRPKLPAGAVTTLPGLGYVVAPAMRERLLQGYTS